MTDIILQIPASDMLLDKHAVASMFKCAESTIETMLRDKGSKFPEPFRLGIRSEPLWRIEDLKRWIDAHYEK